MPRLLVGELPGEFRPAGITDRAGEVAVADQVGDGEVLQAQPVVGLDELAGDLMQILKSTKVAGYSNRA